MAVWEHLWNTWFSSTRLPVGISLCNGCQLAAEVERQWGLTELQRLNSPLILLWTALSSGKRCLVWEKALLKVCSEAVPQRKMHVLRCGGVFTLFFLFPSCWLVWKFLQPFHIPRLYHACHIADFWAFFPIFLLYLPELLLAIRLFLRDNQIFSAGKATCN